ncbi:DUF4349 domain-containing protein [Dyadobacter psychrotolerans]|uniref:DUF4349 domain-containing protein n=1 Tax=Dyadobacter psychrotolerans TaxID=2541721 RepID=A0A4R5DRT7_9BACT|nr:DUF4349 domain-containing protein [Dyadobacter psychrotolerans]TDE13805.1 DUF4349 domain-containing protein [Dyadobacter psychrotolerans]
MKNLILLGMFSCFLACSQKPETDALAMNIDLMAAPQPMEIQVGPEIQTEDKSSVVRKLVKNGIVEFETADVDKTKSQITAAVSANKGYVSSDQENKMADKRNYTLVVRIPSSKFDTFLVSATKGVLYFDRKQINVKDVTAEYADHETRLKTQKEIEARYLQLLNRASTVKDILEIEKELGTIRTEIESAEGRLNLLKDEIGYSTLEINFYKVSSTPALFSYQIKSAFVKGWENLLGFVLIVIDHWPFVLLGTGLWFAVARFRRRRRFLKHPEEV